MEAVLPKIEAEAISKSYGKFIIGPLESGYGLTLGNALRRMLLASLTGAAPTSVKVDGIHHEFSPIAGAKEDMTGLILNLKQLRFKLHEGEQSARLHLEAKGRGNVTAGDIQLPAHVELINPDQHLITLDGDSASLDMDLTVQRGKGYSPSEERGKLPVDEIPIDAIFSPIKKANFRVEPARVGQVTNYDNLLLEVWTDGSISPREAITEAAKMLVRHFSLVAGFAGEVEAEIAPESEIPSRVYDTPIEELELSVRAYNCLKRANITKVGEVLERLRKSKEEILNIRNFGQKSLDELMERLQAKGYLDSIQPAADLLTPAEEGGESETPSEGE